jgi:TonB family protein
MQISLTAWVVSFSLAIVSATDLPRQRGLVRVVYDACTPGLVAPVVVRQVKPDYSPAAMHAQKSGTVVLGVVIEPTGLVGDVSVVNSIDRIHGLDTEAVRVARRWVFTPGRFAGRPVPVRANIRIEFKMWTCSPEGCIQPEPPPSPPESDCRGG